jgi:hypothetical protein
MQKQKTKKEINPESNQIKNILSLQNVLTSFDSEEKTDNYDNVKRRKKIEINYDDKNFLEKYMGNSKLNNNQIDRIRKKSNLIRELNYNDSSKINLRRTLSEGEMKYKNDSNLTQTNLIPNSKNYIKVLDIVNPIKLEFLKIEINKTFNNSISKTKEIYYIEEKNINNNNDDHLIEPLKEFFLLTFQAVKVNYSEYFEILNLINPEILYQEVKMMNIPFHKVIFIQIFFHYLT